MKNSLLLLAVLLGFSQFTTLQAQDPQFTQFYASPLTLNPALTGAFNGLFRASGIYRDQWRGALDNPYVTYSAAADVRFGLDLGSRYQDALGAGMIFYSDRVNILEFNTNQLGFSTAFHKGLDDNKKQVLSLGLQASVVQRNLNYENLTFEDQFNGTSGYTGGTAEVLPENNFAFADFSVGLNYSYNPSERTVFILGGAMHHFNNPRISFYDPSTDPNVEESEGENLYPRYSGQFMVEFPITKDRSVSLSPRALFTTQGPHASVTAGSNIRFKLPAIVNMGMQIGGWARPVKNEDGSWEVDAIAALLGFEVSGLFIGLSYDVNLEDVSNYRQGQNAFEISISYIGEYEDETILCPSF